jgi:2-polyprenyl-3-methyl-5-hydroxy-6-metoxy-1,4-benzoquinol methylase
MFKEEFSYQIKKIRNYPVPYIHFNEQWFKDIVDCQREIRYLSNSARAERSWWMHIPKWIREDWLGRSVENCVDVGCGYGTLAIYCRRLLNCPVYCIDFKQIISPLLAKKYGIKFSLGNFEMDPFPWDLNFDIVVFTEILEHLNFHPVPILRRLRDMLSRNGRLYLSTPDAAEWGKRTIYYTGIDKIPYPETGHKIVDDHVYVYNKDELLSIIDTAGLKVLRFGYSPGVLARHFNLTLTKR